MPEHIVQIFDTIKKPKIAIAVAVTFYCGLRISEVCNLKIENVDLKNKIIKIQDAKYSRRSKTNYGKDRYIVFPDVLLKVIVGVVPDVASFELVVGCNVVRVFSWFGWSKDWSATCIALDW